MNALFISHFENNIFSEQFMMAVKSNENTDEDYLNQLLSFPPDVQEAIDQVIQAISIILCFFCSIIV